MAEGTQEGHQEGVAVAAQAVDPLLGTPVACGRRGEGRRGPELGEVSVIRLVRINHGVAVRQLPNLLRSRMSNGVKWIRDSSMALGSLAQQ